MIRVETTSLAMLLGFAALLSSGMSLRSMREVTRFPRHRTEAPASD